jgi:hypothetical protein
MYKVNALVVLVLVVAAGLGLAIMLGAVPSESLASASAPVEVKSHWRHHDGHWSYWDAGDKRWYYTDGSNWFYNDGDVWNVYRFDKTFGTVKCFTHIGTNQPQSEATFSPSVNGNVLCCNSRFFSFRWCRACASFVRRAA